MEGRVMGTGAGAGQRAEIVGLVVGLVVGLALLAWPGAVAAQQVWQTRTPAPAWLGIGYEIRWAQRDGTCEPRVWIDRVVQGSPAERAGFRRGDAILSLDDEPLPGARLEAVALRLHPGDSLRFSVERDGRVRRLTAVADRRPARPPIEIMEPSRTGAVGISSAPIVELDGQTLVARNVESGLRGVRGYWLATGGGEPEYRRLGSRSRDDLDERVVRLLRCAEEAGSRAVLAPRVDLQRLQQRADSLRVIITRRALAPTPAPPEGRAPTPPGHPAPAPTPLPEGMAADLRAASTYILRMEDHLAEGLRGVAGAEVTAMEPELASYFRNARGGLLVLRVTDGSAADRAGLRPGDVIVEGDGRGLQSAAELRALLSRPNPQDVRLRVVRKGRTQLLSLPRSGY